MSAFSAYSENPFAVSEVRLDANAFMIGIVVTASVGTVDYDAKATIVSPAATATFTANVFDDVDAKATIVSPAATATFNNGGIEDADAQATASVTGVSATTASGTQTANGKATIVPPAATATFTAGVAGYDAKAITDPLTGVYLHINNYDLADEDAQATATVSGVAATTTADWDTVNGIYAVTVVYLNTDFERKRTVNIVPYGNYTVYVTR